MPLTDYLTASGQRVHGGQQGLVYSNAGRIWISTPAHIGIDSNLFACLKICVDILHLSINVNSIDTGQHSLNSRHYTGRAADINKVGPILGSQQQATLTNPHAQRLVHYLMANGFRAGEGGPWASILWGPIHTSLNPSSINHSTHLHCSVPYAVGAPGSPNAVEEPTEDI